MNGLILERANAGMKTMSGGAQCGSAAPEEVLQELFELLEEFGPAWYTEEHHNRTLAALGHPVSSVA
jgi:hypothetical protein